MAFRHVVLFAATLMAAQAESVAGLQWKAPDGWKNLGSQTMRAATYSVPAAAGDKAGAECVVYFFGQGQGGPVEANIERWKGQFQTPDGKPAAGKTGVRVVNGLNVTTLD